MMEYKGYVGQVEFDDEANLFHGEVIKPNPRQNTLKCV